MEQCSICLDALDGGVAALACGHRFHAACLASMAGAVGHGCDYVPARDADGPSSRRARTVAQLRAWRP